MRAIVSSFLLVALSETGDKTQLLALSLAARFRRPWVVMAGILTAIMANHLLAAAAGSWIAERVPARLMAGVLGILFVAFAIWTLRPDSLDEGAAQSRFGPYLSTVVLFFLAEMGDKTQLATVALAAQFHSIVLVTMGSTLGMLASDGLAVFLGDRLADRLPLTWIRRVTAALFLAFAAGAAWRALG
jgi:putative Ca2+/H+ antiporter (TMEM165/GDT1 family)